MISVATGAGTRPGSGGPGSRLTSCATPRPPGRYTPISATPSGVRCTPFSQVRRTTMHDTAELAELANGAPALPAEQSRWIALVVLCAGMLMIVLARMNPSSLTQNQPFPSAVQNDLEPLASPCGLG